jgi:hypothetical protein
MKFGSIRLLLVSLSSTRSLVNSDPKHKHRLLSRSNVCANMSPPHSWTAFDTDQEEEARTKLAVWPLDEYNAQTLNEVHPRNYVQSTTDVHDVYDLIALGAGAGGLVSSTSPKSHTRIIFPPSHTHSHISHCPTLIFSVSPHTFSTISPLNFPPF